MRTWSLALLLVGALSGASAQVAKSGTMFSELRLPDRVASGHVAVLGEHGEIAGDWISFSSSGNRANDWTVAFDTMSFDPVESAPFSGIYGQTFGPVRFANTYRNPFFAIDIQQLAPGAAGQSALRFVTDIVWNPGGTWNRSGSGRLAMLVTTTQSFGLNSAGVSFDVPFGPPVAGTPFSGLVVDFGVQSHGWRTYDVNLTNTGLSIPLPLSASTSNPASLIVVMGTINAQGQFAPCPPTWAMQPTIDTMAAPNDPNYPGLNPSQSGPLQWDDDGGSVTSALPNWIHDNWTTTGNQFTELYTYDFSGSNGGFRQAAAALFYSPLTPRWTGVAQESAPSPMIPLRLVASTAAGVPLAGPSGDLAQRILELPLDALNRYKFTDPRIALQGGDFADHVLIVAGGRTPTLRKVMGPFNLSSGFQLPTIELNFGDIDASSEVDAADIDAIIARFGAVPLSPNWNAVADLDFSREIDAADIDIAIANFGRISDPAPSLP